MLAGLDVETPAWHGRGVDGMLGCSPGEGGKGRGMGLTGGNPGEVCCGVWRALEAFGYASLASGSLVSGSFASGSCFSRSAAGRFGVGASGKVSSAAAISGGSVAIKRATGRSATGRSSGGGRVGVRSASGLRCALAPQQASEVRPTRVGTSRAHLRSRPRCISGVPVLLIRTKIRGDMSRGLLIAAEDQMEQVGAEFEDQFAPHIGCDRGGKAG